MRYQQHVPSLSILTAAVVTVLGCTADVSTPEGHRTAELATEDAELEEIEGLPAGVRVWVSDDEEVVIETVEAGEANATFDDLLGQHAWVPLEITDDLDVRDRDDQGWEDVLSASIDGKHGDSVVPGDVDHDGAFRLAGVEGTPLKLRVYGRLELGEGVHLRFPGAVYLEADEIHMADDAVIESTGPMFVRAQTMTGGGTLRNSSALETGTSERPDELAAPEEDPGTSHLLPQDDGGGGGGGGGGAGGVCGGTAGSPGASGYCTYEWGGLDADAHGGTSGGPGGKGCDGTNGPNGPTIVMNVGTFFGGNFDTRGGSGTPGGAGGPGGKGGDGKYCSAWVDDECVSGKNGGKGGDGGKGGNGGNGGNVTIYYCTMAGQWTYQGTGGLGGSGGAGGAPGAGGTGAGCGIGAQGGGSINGAPGATGGSGTLGIYQKSGFECGGWGAPFEPIE